MFGKVFSDCATINYQQSYALHVCCGILFNHDSARWGETFATWKIIRAVWGIKHGLQRTQYLGTLRPNAIGDTPAITCRPCGACSSSGPQTIL